MTDEFTWDDRLWDQVWKRTLSHVERHSIAMAVLRRRLPTDAFQERIARELANRWSRHAVTLGSVYLLWTLFWGAIGWSEFRVNGAQHIGLPAGCAVVGVIAVAACGLFRRAMRRLP